jgi:hypothetical protein
VRVDKHQRASRASLTHGQDGLYRHKSVQGGCGREVHYTLTIALFSLISAVEVVQLALSRQAPAAYHRPENAPVVLARECVHPLTAQTHFSACCAVSTRFTIDDVTYSYYRQSGGALIVSTQDGRRD